MNKEQTPSATDLMINDLAERVAQISVDASAWRARALLAEEALKDLKDLEADEVGQLTALPDPKEA